MHLFIDGLQLACVADESAYLVEIMSAEENSFLQTTGSASKCPSKIYLNQKYFIPFVTVIFFHGLKRNEATVPICKVLI
jgi:hypothetical protein